MTDLKADLATDRIIKLTIRHKGETSVATIVIHADPSKLPTMNFSGDGDFHANVELTGWHREGQGVEITQVDRETDNS